MMTMKLMKMMKMARRQTKIKKMCQKKDDGKEEKKTGASADDDDSESASDEEDQLHQLVKGIRWHKKNHGAFDALLNLREMPVSLTHPG